MQCPGSNACARVSRDGREVGGVGGRCATIPSIGAGGPQPGAKEGPIVPQPFTRRPMRSTKSDQKRM